MLAILDQGLRRTGLTRKGVIMGLLTTFLITVPLAAFSPYTAAQPENALGDSDAGVVTAPAVEVEKPSASSPVAACDKLPNSQSSSRNVHEDDERPDDRTFRLIQWTPGRCVEVVMNGVVAFTADERDVASLGRRASVRFRERVATGEREMTITSDAGRLRREYRVNGREAAFDESAPAWLAQMVLTAIRESEYDAPARVRRLARQGGTNRVLSEIEAIQSSGAKRTYYAEYLEAGAPFADSTLTRILAHMEREYQGSSGDFRTLLQKIPAQSVRTQGSRSALVAAIARIESDGDKADMLRELIPTADRELLIAIMGAARHIGSDGDKSGLLVLAAPHYLSPRDAQLRQAFFEVAVTVESDGDLMGVLLTTVQFAQADPAVTDAALRAARHIDSDGDIADVLTAIAVQGLLKTQQLKDLYLEAVKSIDSDGDRIRALRAAMLD